MKSVFLVSALLLVVTMSSGCRKDQPPAISIVCIGDGHGGCDGTHADGTNEYVPPSGMKGMWCTTETDEANFASWCYKTSVKSAQREMDKIKARINDMTRAGLLSEDQARMLASETSDK